MEQFPLEESRSSEGFDITRLMSKLLRNWYWLVISSAIFVAAAYLYLRYTVPLYQVSAFLQVETGSDAASMIGGSPFQSGASAKPREQYKDMNSELFKFRSAQLVGDVVDSLALNIDVSFLGTVKSKPVFIETLPFTINVKSSTGGTANYSFKLGDSTFRIIHDKDEVVAPFGTFVQVHTDSIRIIPRDSSYKQHLHQDYSLTVTSRSGAVQKYMERIAVTSVPKAGVGMLQVTVKDELVERGKRIVELLKNRYDVTNFEYRNRALQSEIEFLNQRVAAVDAELEYQENYVKNFKAGNKMTDVTSSANQLLGNLASIETRKSDNVYKDKLLALVEADLVNNAGKEERLNVTGLQDGDLAMQVNKYNELVAQKKNLLLEAAPQDLRLPPINAKLEDARNAVLSRVNSLRAEVSASNQFLQTQEKSTAGMFSTLPGKEKDFIQVNRLLNIKQALYVFLLQRKEDKSIELASAGMGESRTIDWKVSDVQDPKPLYLYLFAALLGAIVPAIVIVVRMIMNKMIETSRDISLATKIPVIGEIAFAGKVSDEKIVLTDGTSAVAEHFRTLRTNLLFHCQRKFNSVVLVTSGVSGEGKSYVSLNLATSLALSGKKTVLLEFDLRDPGILQNEEISRKPGILNFLSEEIGLSTLVNPVDGCPNLFFISSGLPLTLSTGELLLDFKVKVLFEYLKLHYDFIVMDTPPVEAVSDALVLNEFADLSIFVIRHKYSSRTTLELINKLNEDHKINNPFLVVNSILPGGDFNNVHGYGYGYGSVNRYNNKKRKHQKSRLKIA